MGENMIHGPMGPIAGILVGCCALVYFLLFDQVLLWAQDNRCKPEQLGPDGSWNRRIPANTTTQMRSSWRVDIYDETTSTEEIGSWSASAGMWTRWYTYVPAGGPTAFEAIPHRGSYLGDRYDLRACSNLQEYYSIEEDFRASSWLSRNSSKVYNILQMPEAAFVAKCHYSETPVSFFRAYWEASVESRKGEAVSTLRQDSRTTHWFSYRKWRVDNARPDLLPNEVVSFLAAMYDMNLQREAEKQTEEEDLEL